MRMASSLVAKRDATVRIATAMGKVRVSETSAGGVTLGNYVAQTQLQQVVRGARMGRAWHQKQSDGSMLAFQEMILPRSQWPVPPRASVASTAVAKKSDLLAPTASPDCPSAKFTVIRADLGL